MGGCYRRFRIPLRLLKPRLRAREHTHTHTERYTHIQTSKH